MKKISSSSSTRSGTYLIERSNSSQYLSSRASSADSISNDEKIYLTLKNSRSKSDSFQFNLKTNKKCKLSIKNELIDLFKNNINYDLLIRIFIVFCFLVILFYFFFIIPISYSFNNKKVIVFSSF